MPTFRSSTKEAWCSVDLTAHAVDTLVPPALILQSDSPVSDVLHCLQMASMEGVVMCSNYSAFGDWQNMEFDLSGWKEISLISLKTVNLADSWSDQHDIVNEQPCLGGHCAAY